MINLIILLSVYLPYEEIVLKVLPLSDQQYIWARQIPDLVVFSMAFILLIGQSGSSKKIMTVAGRNVVNCFVLFLLWSLAVLAINQQADIFIALANIKALLRYVLLIFIIIILNPSDGQIRKIMWWVMIAVGGQMIIGFIQFFGGIPARDFLAARHVADDAGLLVKNFTGDRFEGVNDLMGTMGDTISFAFFMIIGMTVWIFSYKGKALFLWLGVVAFLILIYLSGSRTATLVAIILPIGFIVWRNGLYKSAVLMAVMSLFILPIGILVLGVDISIDMSDRRSFQFMFTEDYVESAMNQRLGIISRIFPQMLFDMQAIVGFSSDKNVFIRHALNEYTEIPYVLSLVLPHVLEDVYWVALYAYYGLIGFLMFSALLYFMIKRVRILANLENIDKHLCFGKIALTLLLLALFLNVFNQAFEVRSFSFYMWLFCGFALVILGRFRKSQGRHFP